MRTRRLLTPYCLGIPALGEKEKPQKLQLTIRAGKILGLVFVLMLVMIAGFMLRLRAGPTNIDFAKPYIEEALKNSENGRHASLDHVLIHWPQFTGPIILGIEGARILDAQDQVVLSVNEVGLGLKHVDLLLGKIVPVALIVREPNLRLLRSETGEIDIGVGEENQKTSEMTVGGLDQQTDLAASIFSYIANPEEFEAISPLATLEAFEIQDARVEVQDYMMQRNWSLPDVDISIGHVAVGLNGRLNINLEEAGGQEARVNAKFIVYWDTKQIQTQASLQNFDLSNIAQKFPALGKMSNQNVPLNAEVSALFDASFKPLSARMYVFSERGEINMPDVYDSPLDYKDMYLDLAYEDNENEAVLEIVGLGLTAREVSIKATTNLDIDRKIVQGPVRIEIEDLSHEKIAPLWPKFLKGDNSEEWILHKVSNGLFKNVYAQANVELIEREESWYFDFFDLIAGFEFENTAVDYRAPLTPLSEAEGSGLFNYTKESLELNINSARIDSLNVEGAKVVFSNIIEAGAGVAEINAKITGGLSSVFKYIEDEPLSQTQEFDITKVSGDAALDLNINFPLHRDVKKEEVKTNLKGTLANVSIPNVTRDLALTEGTFDLKVEGINYVLDGAAKIEGQEMDILYSGFVDSEGQLYKQKIHTEFLSDNKLRKRLGIEVNEFIDGLATIKVDHTEYNDKPSEAAIDMDITEGRLLIDPFDYEKPVGKKANIHGRAIIENGVLTQIRDITAIGPGLKIEDAAFRFKGKDTKLHLGRLDRIVVGETIASINFEVEPSGRYKIIMKGPFVDLRPFLATEEEKAEAKTGPAVVLSLNADALRTADNETIQYGKFYVDIDEKGRFNQLEMDAVVGAGDVYLRYKPDEKGMRTFRFEADDAGAALKAFGVFENMKGGTMVIYGEPIQSVYDRNLIGVAEIRDFTVTEAPTIAKLLSALSLNTVVSTAEGGLKFSKLQANFDWLYRPEGSILVLKDGRTSGNSLGLTFDGIVDNAGGDIDMSGTIVPISGLNNMLSSIPIVGDILTGGTGGVFAATYTIEGKTKDPEISVNPLSALAPGILRRILFEQN